MGYLDNYACNRDECLRKFKSEKTGISEWCGVVGDKLEEIKPNSNDCPLFCDSFFCYKTKEIIKKHEDTYWICDTVMSDEYKETYGVESINAEFSGLSKKGHEKSDEEFKFRKTHHCTNNIVCPYCDYEIIEWWNYIYLDSDKEFCNTECPECGHEFRVEINNSITFTTDLPENKEYI